jgi:hypothetical protein
MANREESEQPVIYGGNILGGKATPLIRGRDILDIVESVETDENGFITTIHLTEQGRWFLAAITKEPPTGE